MMRNRTVNDGDEINPKQPKRPYFKPGPKFTRAEKEKVMTECMEKILHEHMNWKQFTDWIRDKYNIRDGHRYWKNTWELIRSQFSDDREDMMSKIQMMLFDLNKRSKNDDDKKMELESLKEISKLMGLHQAQVLSVKADGKGKVEIKLDLGED